MYTFSAKKMGKGTDNKIRKNLIISCLVELIAEQLRGKNVEMQKVSVKSQLEEHLSAKLVVKIIQDLHERLNSKAKAEFAVNLLADVQLLRNGKIPSAASQAENILPGAIAAISQLIPGHTQAEIASTGPTLASASSSTPTAASTPPSNKQKSEQAQSKPEAKTKTKPDAVEEKPKSNPNPKSKPDPEQQEPKSQQPEVAEQPQAQAQPSPTNQAAVSKPEETKGGEESNQDSGKNDKKRSVEEATVKVEASAVKDKNADAGGDIEEGEGESPMKKTKLEVEL